MRKSQVAIFDLDGVVIDTAAIIEQSYLDVGAPPPPQGFMELTWQEWLVPLVGLAKAQALHEAKNARYIELVSGASVLGGYEAAHRLRRNPGWVIGVLTGAPWATLPALISSFMHWPFDFAAAGYRIGTKLHVMRQLGPGGVYVDDLDYRCDVAEVGWHFIRYVGQNGNQLSREMDEATWIST